MCLLSQDSERAWISEDIFEELLFGYWYWYINAAFPLNCPLEELPNLCGLSVVNAVLTTLCICAIVEINYYCILVGLTYYME